MKLSELRKEVYRIAKVTTTRQLKAQYDKIKSLDMRYKASWTQALAWVKAPEQREALTSKKKNSKNKASEQKKSRKKQQKGKKPSTLSKTLRPDKKKPASFEDWLNNPPDEYKELFTEADSALGAFDQKLDKAKRLTNTVKAMAESLDEFAEASAAEAQQISQVSQRDRDRSKQADLN